MRVIKNWTGGQGRLVESLSTGPKPVQLFECWKPGLLTTKPTSTVLSGSIHPQQQPMCFFPFSSSRTSQCSQEGAISV